MFKSPLTVIIEHPQVSIVKIDPGASAWKKGRLPPEHLARYVFDICAASFGSAAAAILLYYRKGSCQ